MRAIRQQIGGLGNLMFKQAFIYGLAREGIIPDVYVQSEAYFHKYKDEVKQMYSDGIGFTDAVSIHIRKGDYADKNGFYVDLTETDYYDKAIALFPNEKFLIFCADRQGKDEPDREWVKKWATKKKINFELWEGESETDDLNKMASCKSNIMANSTFSWWAAYLNPKPEKIICPQNWFTDGVYRVGLLDSWIKI